jgi:hypothetical protein
MALTYDLRQGGCMETTSDVPVGVSAFIGRERERAEVGDLVMEMRVATLIGSGGCGKTRLAMEVAGDVASRFSDGVCWVDLAGVSEPKKVAPAIGAAMGVEAEPGPAAKDHVGGGAVGDRFAVADNLDQTRASHPTTPPADAAS